MSICDLSKSWSVYYNSFISVLGLWSLVTLNPCSTKYSSCLLHRIWSLTPRSHSRVVHLVANLHSFFSVIYRRSKSLLSAATQNPSLFVLSFVIPLSTVSLFVDTIPCLVVVTSNSIILKTSFVLL